MVYLTKEPKTFGLAQKKWTEKAVILGKTSVSSLHGQRMGVWTTEETETDIQLKHCSFAQVCLHKRIAKTFQLGCWKYVKCRIHETIVAPHKDFFLKKSRLDVDTWPIRLLSHLSQVKTSYWQEKKSLGRADLTSLNPETSQTQYKAHGLLGAMTYYRAWGYNFWCKMILKSEVKRC